MNNHTPLVSVGLPVYNGENYLEVAIDSILAQTCTDLELIIADNNSTDRTQAICESYAAQDLRIHYYRNEKNLGAARNFNRTFELSSGKYFKWMAHDDLIAPEFLSRCVEALEKNTDVVLCATLMHMIDSQGKVIDDYADTNLELTSSPDPIKRFRELIRLDYACFDVFGLIRVEALRATPLIASYVTSDRALLAELSLMGRYYTVPEHLFFPREHPERSTRALSTHERAAWFDTANKGKVSLPRWQVYLNYFKIIRKSSLNFTQKAKCRLYLLTWLLRYGKSMAKDLIMAVYLIPRRFLKPSESN